MLAAAGYHVIAPDQRGYGRTPDGIATYDADLGRSGSPAGARRDRAGVGVRLARRAVIGHDAGASVAAWCALTRPDCSDRSC